MLFRRSRRRALQFNRPQIQSLESRRLLAAVVPRPDHIVVVVEENHSYPRILGDPLFSPRLSGVIPPTLWHSITPSVDDPFIRSLAKGGANFTHAKAERHPSEPNYLALFSGSTQGVASDAIPKNILAGPSFGGQLIGAGLSFTGYSEGLPSVGFTGAKAGQYARKHNPWVDFADVPASANQPFTAFPNDFSKLPTVSFVVPNQKHDMHSGSVASADHWLKKNLGPYARWAKTHNSLLIVTWDEGAAGNNHIPTIIYGANVKRGNFGDPVNHYRLLATIERMYHLKPLGNAAGLVPLNRPFKHPAGATPAVFSQTPIAPGEVTSVWKKLQDES